MPPHDLPAARRALPRGPATIPILACLLLTPATPAPARSYATIEVQGAQFIPEDDIRDTCGAFPGVDYADYDLRAIEDCLMLTGVFSRVTLIPDPETDRLVIAVEEIDTRPGRLEGALSYVSQDGFVGELSLEKYNLFPDTFGALHLSFNQDVRTLEGNLYRRGALGEGLDLGLDVVAREAEFDDRSYAERGLRIEPYLAWPRDDGLRFEAGLGWRDYRQTDVAEGANPLTLREETSGIAAPYLRLTLALNRQGEAPPGEPAPGYGFRIDQVFWNLGTDDALSDTRAELTSQLPLGARTRLLTGLRAGHVTGLDGNATRAVDRYFLGADSFRGFAPRGVGPRHAGEAVGGNSYLVASVEVQRDIGTVFSLPVRAGLFVDAGASWGLDDSLDGVIDDSRHSRATLGLSMTFEVSGTPVSLYVATPVRSEPGDETQAFGLAFTARF